MSVNHAHFNKTTDEATGGGVGCVIPHPTNHIIFTERDNASLIDATSYLSRGASDRSSDAINCISNHGKNICKVAS